jgi:SAM-dependent MidA family methyltransferase
MAKLGPGGDFITAPELGSLFARCLAQTISAAGTQLGNYSVLELGAGSGVLAADLLDALQGNLPERYLILERSADMVDRQRSLLRDRQPDFHERIQWLQEPPANFTGVIIGNEIVDALPMERFVIADGSILQTMVGEAGGELQELSRPAPAGLAEQVSMVLPQDLMTSAGPYQSEINPHLASWLHGIASGLDSGLLILSDYGYPRREYYHPDRNRGTMLCHYRHRAHDDALFWPGLQDITASVEFTAVAEAGVATGLDLLAYTSQAGYLISAGLENAMTDPEQLDGRGRLVQAQQIKRLTLPGDMGERFQFMLLGRNMAEDLPGMTGPDLRYRL